MDTEKIIKRIQRVSLSCELKTDEGVRHFHNGHEYVEIGGVKWATMNVGAEKPTDYGFYFQWGDTQGYTADKVGRGVGQKYFGWEDYKFNPSGDGETFTKYNNADKKTTVLDLEDDAVRANWGGSWRMPTDEEFKTLLIAPIYSRWVADYQGSGINGYLFIDETDNSKTLFLPTAGCAHNGDVDYVGRFGSFWSSSLYTPITIGGRYLGFGSGGLYMIGDCYVSYGGRCFGFPVRGVVD